MTFSGKEAIGKLVDHLGDQLYLLGSVKAISMIPTSQGKIDLDLVFAYVLGIYRCSASSSFGMPSNIKIQNAGPSAIPNPRVCLSF